MANTYTTELTPKQARFVQEYIIDLNATQAYIRAGYAIKSLAVAGIRGHDLVKNSRVALAIQEAQKAREARTNITQDKVLRELSHLGFSNMADYAAWDNDSLTIKPSVELTREQTAAIQEITATSVTTRRDKVTETRTVVKVKLADKEGALDKLGRHLGMYPKEGIDLTVIVPVQVVISEASRKAI